MYDLLAGMRVVEADAFVAGPSCGLHLAQFGAEVIRIDPIAGGPDFRRWPVASGSGASLYWEGLNKSKKSVALDLSRPEGRELAARIITAPGTNAGLFVTNYPVDGFLAYETLAERRVDLICVRIMGWPDGRSAVDYTVNASVGLPDMTGPADDPRPVNHVLPAWDLLTGAYAAFSLVSAERARHSDHRGREVRIPLSDMAIASLGHLGQIGEVQTTQRDRERHGNELFGSFGRDFLTRDAKRLMVVAVTPRQWTGLVAALKLKEPIYALETELGVRFAENEGARFYHRHRLIPLVEEAIGQIDAAQLSVEFQAHAVCWAPYQSLHEAINRDAYFSSENPMLSNLDHPSGLRYLAAGSAATIPEDRRRPPQAAPVLGRDTQQVLSDLLGLSAGQIGELRSAGLVGGT